MAAPNGTRAAPRVGPQEFDIAIGEHRSFGSDRWKLYDEKYLFQPTSAYTGRDGSGWLLSFRGYLAGRTAELDRLFDYLEKSGDEAKNNIGWMLQCASNEEVSKQLWALLAALLEGPDRCVASATCRATMAFEPGR